jgi:hypothetical protein
MAFKKLFILFFIFAPCVFAQKTITGQVLSFTTSAPINCSNLNGVRCISAGNPQGWAGTTADQWLTAAINSLPACTLPHQLVPFNTPPFKYRSYTYNHCGEIDFAEGSYTFAAQVSMINSPYITIKGADNGSTYFNYTGTTGCAIVWTGNTNVTGDDLGGGGLYNVRIDGFSSGAGTCGLQTENLTNWHMSNVDISNFSGLGSSGWYDTNGIYTCAWSEKRFVSGVELLNNTIGWSIVHSTNGGVCGGTMGYGFFDVSFIVFSGQTGLVLDGGSTLYPTNLDYSELHLMFNIVSNPANASGIVLKNSAQMAANHFMIHMEAPYGMGTGSEFNICSTCSIFYGAGFIDQDWPGSNVGDIRSGVNNVSASASADSIGFQSTMNQYVAKPSNWTYGNVFQTNYNSSSNNGTGNFFSAFAAARQNGTGTIATMDDFGAQLQLADSGTVTSGRGFHVLAPSILGGGNAINSVGVQIDQQKVTGITYGYGIIQSGATDSNSLAGSLKIGDQGSCTMAAGTCAAQSLTHTYAVAPNCVGNWNGSGVLTGLLKFPSTTTTVTPASSVGTDTAVVNWICFGN